MSIENALTKPSTYQITVDGPVSEALAAQLGMTATPLATDSGEIAVISGTVIDQAALLGVLGTLCDIGYTLMGVQASPVLKSCTHKDKENDHV